MRADRAFEVESANGSVYAVGKVSCRPKPVNEAPGADTGGIATDWSRESVAGDSANLDVR